MSRSFWGVVYDGLATRGRSPPAEVIQKLLAPYVEARPVNPGARGQAGVPTGSAGDDGDARNADGAPAGAVQHLPVPIGRDEPTLRPTSAERHETRTAVGR